MGGDVVLVSSADETAFEVRAELLGGGAIGRASGETVGEHRFLSSGDVETFRRLGARLLGPELDRVEPTPWR